MAKKDQYSEVDSILEETLNSGLNSGVDTSGTDAQTGAWLRKRTDAIAQLLKGFVESGMTKDDVLSNPMTFKLLRNSKGGQDITDAEFRSMIEVAFSTLPLAPKEEFTVTSIRISKTLHKEVKEYCAKHKMKMNELMTSAMELYIRKNS